MKRYAPRGTHSTRSSTARKAHRSSRHTTKEQEMHQRTVLGGGWARGGVAGSGVVRRAHPASGAQWNVQVVRGKVNGKCLWNACKALSLGLLLMVLGAAMATIGYYAEDLSIAQEVRGNHTVRVKNESRGFHLNNLSYAGPIVMGVGGFIVVAACVMTFEARDSAAKVVPARFKLNNTRPSTGVLCSHHVSCGGSGHGSLRTSGSQTAGTTSHQCCVKSQPDRRAMTQSFMQFSRGLVLDKTQNKNNSLKVPQVAQASINKSPSAPDLVASAIEEKSSVSPILKQKKPEKISPKSTSKMTSCAASALLNPRLLQRHALSVDETSPNYRISHESLHGSGSQGSMAMDLHLECPVTLRIQDQRRNPLRRQRRVVDEEERHVQEDSSRRSSHSCSPRLQACQTREAVQPIAGGSAHQLPTHSSHCSSRRRSSNASNTSDCTHRSRTRRRDCAHHSRGRLERAISSDSRLTGAIPKCHHHRHQYSSAQTSTEQEPGGFNSDTDIRHTKNFHKSLFVDAKAISNIPETQAQTRY